MASSPEAGTLQAHWTILGRLLSEFTQPRMARKLKFTLFSAICGVERELRMKVMRYRSALVRLVPALEP
jgi:hypothetical protein